MAVARTIGALVAGVAALGLTGCVRADPQATQAAADAQAETCPVGPGPVAMALADRANAPRLDPAQVSGEVRHVLDAAGAQPRHLTIVDTTGTPAQVADVDLGVPADSGDNTLRTTSEIRAALDRTPPRSGQANPLAALRLAAARARAQGDGGTVVLIDSGIATTGALDYRQPGMLMADGRDLAARARTTGQLPDLTGLTVVLAGLGDTTAPQQPLDDATRAHLREQWREIARAAGAACVAVDTEPVAGSPVRGAPAVTPVPLPQAPSYDLSRPVALHSNVLTFEPDSAALTDADVAEQRLRPLAESLQRTTGTVELTGTTASQGTPEHQVDLSLERANTVRDILVGFGLDPARIQTQGVGTGAPGHVPDVDADGNLLPGPAAQNRSVVVTVEH